MGGILNRSMSAQRYCMKADKFEHLQLVCKRFGFRRGTIDKFFKTWKDIDLGLTGKISLIEFLDFFDLERTTFAKRTFMVFDHDQNGTIDFLEFILSVYNYCTFDWDGLVRYAFDLFDESGDGVLEMSEVQSCVQFVYGRVLDDRILKIIKKMDDDHSGTLSFDEFRKYNRSFPVLLFPAFHTQELMRKKFLGKSFWYNETLRLEHKILHGEQTVLAVLRDMNLAHKEEGTMNRATKEPVESSHQVFIGRGQKGQKSKKGAGTRDDKIAKDARDQKSKDKKKAQQKVAYERELASHHDQSEANLHKSKHEIHHHADSLEDREKKRKKKPAHKRGTKGHAAGEKYKESEGSRGHKHGSQKLVSSASSKNSNKHHKRRSKA